MIDAAMVAALFVVAGGAIAIAARNGHVVALGLLVALAAAPLVASPLPESIAAAARILGALLSAYLLWTVTRVGPVNSEGSAIGMAAEMAAAATAFAIGLQISPVDPLAGPRVAQAAGLAVLVLAVVPLASQDIFRLGLGVILLTVGSSLLLEAWVGSTPPLTQLALTGLLAGIAGATAILIERPRTYDDLTEGEGEVVEPAKGRA